MYIMKFRGINFKTRHLLLIAIFAFCSLTVSAKEDTKGPLGDFKVAAIDMQRVFSESKYITDTYFQINTERSALDRLIMTADQEVAELKASGDGKKLEKRYLEIQTLLDGQVKGFQVSSDKKLKDMKDRIDSAIEAFADKQNYQIVLDRSFVAGEGPHELTDELIKALDLKAGKK